MTRAPRASAGHDRPTASANPTPAASSSATALQATSSNRSRADERPSLSRERHPSIRLRRRSSSNSLRGRRGSAEEILDERDDPHGISQPRPVAQPPPNVNARGRRAPQTALPRLTEEGPRPTVTELGVGHEDAPLPSGPPRPRRRRLSRLLHRESRDQDQEYDDDLVDFLDIIDPEIQALSTLTNVQNSLFVPDLGNLINRRPAYSLSQYVPDAVFVATPRDEPSRPDLQLDRIPTARDEPPLADSSEESKELPSLQRTSTITSRLSESHYAALPHGMKLDGWTESEKWELDDHVRHMLHSRRSRFKRTMKGFGQYVRRPLGFFVTLYAVLITLFGLAWVLFLIGWIYVGDHQVYAIHIIDSVLVALFAIMGDGLAPFRAVDTYHMAFIVHYSRKLAAKRKFNPETTPAESSTADDADDVDDAISVERIMASTGQTLGETMDPESGRKQMGTDTRTDAQEEDLLSPKQIARLRHHQKKLAKSHSFYKPHETLTHNPFPLSFLISIVVLLDCHSCLQISLGATTWGIDYHHRNAAITTTILCVSIAANLTAALLISLGDKRTRKKEVVELLDRQQLTSDAIKHLQGKRARRREEGGGGDNIS